MTKTDLIAQVAANTEMSKKSAEQAVSAVFEALGKAMTEGEKITISGFGTFEVREHYSLMVIRLISCMEAVRSNM